LGPYRNKLQSASWSMLARGLRRAAAKKSIEISVASEQPERSARCRKYDMTGPSFDTLKLSRALRDNAHFSTEHAKAIATAVAEAFKSESAIDCAKYDCQIASNRDPLFACNVDPLGVRALVLSVSGGGLST
jgi:uncharacterized membrane protein